MQTDEVRNVPDGTGTEGSLKVYTFEDVISDPSASPACDRREPVDHRPLVLDNGCWKARLGLADELEPRLQFRNVVARTRPEPLVGNDIRNIDAYRSCLKSPFERNLITQPDVLESLLDYGSSRIGVDLRTSHLVMTEAPLNPDYCRRIVHELMFEKYEVNSLLTGIDALFSGYASNAPASDALHLVFGHTTCHILPVLGGKLQTNGCQRLNVGGYDLACYLQRLIHLKNPLRTNQITYSRCEELLHNLCCVSPSNYCEVMKTWTRENPEVKLAFPKRENSAKHSEEVDPEAKKMQAQQKKEAQMKRMKEMHRKRWEKKVEELEHQIASLSAKSKKARRDSGDECADEEPDPTSSKRASLVEDLRRAKDKLANLDEDFGKGGEKKTDEWFDEMRKRRQELVARKEKIRAHNAEMGKRHSRASRDRLRMLWQLAAEDKTVAGRKREKRDTFGARDEDWDVYMVVNRDNWDSEHDVDLEIYEIDRLLAQHDEDHRASLSSSESTVPKDIFITTERIRVPEVLFQPAAFIGAAHGGFADGLEACFRAFTAEESQKLADNIVVSGSLAKLPGMRARLEYEIQCMRPFQSHFKVICVEDLTLDAWKGAAMFARNPDNARFAVTRAEYHEFGSVFFKDHPCSNRYYK